MTTFLLVRHALHELGGETIAGRTPNVHLSPDGRRQADALAERLSGMRLDAIYTSPLERTQETAGAMAAKHGLSPHISPEINELDFGEWSGQELEELRPLETWKRFNAFRSGTRAPAGELMPETQLRIVRFMDELRHRHGTATVALVSHADVIKSALAYFLGTHLDLFQRIEISPASVSVVAVADYGPWVLCVNNTEEIALPH